MSNLETIKHKLEEFIKKYYVNELIKGSILFLSIGLLYLLIVLLVEHFLWLGTVGRTVLFWLFIGVEAALLIKFIVIPLFRMFKLSKGLDYKTASRLIGRHFKEVNDKLYNLLQLAERKEQSELLLASINQKASQLKPIPFHIAIDFKKSLRNARFLLVPIGLFLMIAVSGNIKWFSDSYQRVIHYKTAYEPPAPFRFFVLNESLKAFENQPFTLRVRTSGTVIPEEAKVFINGESFYLRQLAPGSFEYTVEQPGQDIEFYLEANEVRSVPYKIEVVKVPTLLNFHMMLDYPAYTGRKDEVIQNSGNAIVPEGTRITWNMETRATEKIRLLADDTTYDFSVSGHKFHKQLKIFKDFPYQISTSNAEVEGYENLSFSIDAVKDEFPELKVQVKKDSTGGKQLYFAGQASDDYELRSLTLVYFPEHKEDEKKVVFLQELNEGFYQFIYTFPNSIELEEGVDYQLYFNVTDNDAIHGGKQSKSQVFSYREQTVSEHKETQLQQQQKAIGGLEKSLDNLNDQRENLEELSKIQKEKKELNYSDRKNLENFLERQKLQEQQMKRFTEELNENLKNFEPEEEDIFKDLLKERMERQQDQIKKNEKLLEELEKLTDKINKEELAKKLEELAKKQNSNKRSLEQILELTKRFYVAQKMQKLQDDIEKLAEKQEQLSGKSSSENTSEKQKHLNNEFNEIQKELDALEKENRELKKPMQIPRDEGAETEISEEQKLAEQKLHEKEQSSENENASPEQQRGSKSEQDARESQKKAAQKMKELSEKMEQSMQMSGGEGLMEDAEALRQILDNLVIFSFEQEELMTRIQEETTRSVNFNQRVRKQRELRTLFEHVDDSLFALSLRRPEISERVNTEITEVFFNIDKALERFPENQIYQGVSSQQYALTSANNLASFLGDVLDNMEEQMQMSASGKGGSGGGFQLPDIIQSQEELNKQMQQQMGEEKGKGEGKKQGKEQGDGKEGEGDKEGTRQGEGAANQGNSDGDGEEQARIVFEIYKQQQLLRQSLENQLDDLKGKGLDGEARRLIREMEQIENKLLERGLEDGTLRRMTNLKHELLKLERASFEQGKDVKRTSRSNEDTFDNPVNARDKDIQEFFNQTEILNRQTLPLRQIYKQKVRAYFKGDD